MTMISVDGSVFFAIPVKKRFYVYLICVPWETNNSNVGIYTSNPGPQPFLKVEIVMFWFRIDKYWYGKICMKTDHRIKLMMN